MHDTQGGQQGISRVVSVARLPVCSLRWRGAVQLIATADTRSITRPYAAGRQDP